MEINEPSTLTFTVSAFLGAVASDAIPYIDMERYAATVDKISTAYTRSVGDGSYINPQGLYAFIKDELRVDDLGSLVLPFYATVNGYRCKVFDRQVNASSSDYIIQYEVLETGHKKALLVTDTGECNEDDNYGLLDIYPF